MPLRLASLIALLALAWLPQAYAAVSVSSARIWPAQDYTRLTLESAKPIEYTTFTIGNPNRIVVDLQDVELRGALDDLAGKISGDDPYIKSIRVGQFKPGVVRLVLDLKTAVKTQLFSLKPVGEYSYRFVLDVYPVVPVDPLMTLALQAEKNLAHLPPASVQTEPQTEAAKADNGNGETPKAEAHKAEPQKTEPPRAHGNGERPLIIVIDAGHGGEDPGARGHRGTQEKDITLAIARKLRDEVNATDGMRAVLTRDGDYFIPLRGRVEKAHQVHADLFVSIHADAYVKSNASGASVFALSEHGATSVMAAKLAKNENEADLVGGINIATINDPYLKRTLLDLSQTVTIGDSLKLARNVLRELGGINSLHRGRVEQAGFAVLKAPDIPSILVETAFISNPREELRLKSDEYQAKVARAVLGGIKRYLAQSPQASRQKIANNN